MEFKSRLFCENERLNLYWMGYIRSCLNGWCNASNRKKKLRIQNWNACSLKQRNNISISIYPGKYLSLIWLSVFFYFVCFYVLLYGDICSTNQLFEHGAPNCKESLDANVYRAHLMQKNLQTSPKYRRFKKVHFSFVSWVKSYQSSGFSQYFLSREKK